MNRRLTVNAALVLFGLVVFGWRLGAHDLWPPDEPRFGLVAREMLERKDPIVLSRNGRLYTDKPPLFFWAIDACALVRGGTVDETAARLPSLLFSVLALVLVARLGARLYDPTTGVLGALLFATSLQILERARWASIDMTLHFFVLAAIVLFWEEVEEAAEAGEVDGARAREGSGARGAGWRAVAAWGAMGLATLAKGPVGLVMPLLAIVPALVVLRRFRDLRRIFPPLGVGLFLLVVAGWFVPFSARLGLGEAVHIATHQTVERYLNAWNAQHPVWYYLWRFPAGFLPWSFFLPAALYAAWRHGPAGGAARDPERTAAILLTFWMAAILLFFSFSTGKRGVYIIPIYPAAALLVARLFTCEAHRATAARAARAFAPFVALAGAVLAFAVPRHQPDFRAAAYVIGGLLVGTAVVTAWGAWSDRTRVVPWGIAAAMGVLMLVGCEMVLPGADRHLNISGFADEVRSRRDPAVPLGTTEEKREDWVFYLKTTVEEVDTPDEILAWIGGGPDRDLLIEEELYRTLAARFPPGVRTLYTGKVSGRPYHLLARRAAAPVEGTAP